MRIAVIAPTQIPARRANTIQVMKMAQALAACGHRPFLLAPGRPEPKPGWEDLAHHYGLAQRSQTASFPVEWLPANPRLRRYDYAWRAVRRARQAGADLVYTRLPQAAALASQAGLATIFELHDLLATRSGRLVMRLFLSGRGARRLVVITQALCDDLRRQIRAPALSQAGFIRIEPDGVDLARFEGLPEPALARRRLAGRLAVPPERFTAGYTGHLYPGRGSELLLDLARRLPEVTFLLAGGEPEEVARLRLQAQGLENVFLAGFVPNAELPEVQAACDALLMPYQRQVAASSGGDIGRYLSPMKLFEYLACGRAILSSDLPVLREVLNPENAVLLPPEDAAAWAAALQDLQAHPELRARLAASARRDAGRYTWEARAGRILEGLTGD
jgi:glycosyltransferase involved in cell wall biosynthesis